MFFKAILQFHFAFSQDTEAPESIDDADDMPKKKKKKNKRAQEETG